MASRKEPQRVISGTLDLLTPDDKMQDGAARLLENFRIDQVGQLRSRRGLVLGAQMGSGNFHTIKLNPNGETVLGVGDSIFVGYGVAVTNGSGFDGTKLGVATHLGSTYVMNRAKQVRITDTTAFPWCPEPPSDAPVASAVTPATVLIEEFDGGGTIDVNTIVDGLTEVPAMTAGAPVTSLDATAQTDNVNFQSGSGSLQVLMNAAGTIKVDVTGAFDTSTAGVAADDDQFSIWVYLSDPTKLQSLSITLRNAPAGDATQGATVQVYLQPGSAWDAGKIIKQGPGTWTQVFIRRKLDVDAFQTQIAASTDPQTVSDLTARLTQLLQNPAFLVTAQQNPQILGINNTPIIAQNAPDFDWTQVVEMVVSAVVTGAVQFNVDAAEFSSVANQAASLSGTGQYYVSFVDDMAHDSLPSPVSNSLTLLNQAARLDSIPVSPAANVLARYIYRQGFGVSAPLRVGTILDNTNAGPWVDPTSNDQAEGDGIYMPTNRTPPPAARGVIGPFFGKLVCFNTALHPSRYFWTPAGIPWAFFGSDSEEIGDWEDAGGDDDEILGATDHKTILVLYKRRSIWRIPGDPVNVDAVKTNGNIGAVGPSAFCSDGAVDFVVSAEGVYLYNLDEEQKISEAIDPIFKGDSVQLAPGEIIPPIEPTAIGTCCIEIANERLRLSYPEVGHSTPNVVLIYNKTTGSWAQERYSGVGFSALAYWGTGLPMTGGAPGGAWYALEMGPDDNGSPIALRWQTKAFDQGLPDINKWYSDIEIEAWLAPPTMGSATLTLKLVLDNGATVITLGTATVNQFTKKTFAFRVPENPAVPIPAGGTDYGYRALNAAIRVEGNATAELIIGGVYLHWYPEERLAHTFDSGPTNFGIPERVKQVDYLEFYSTASGQQLQRTLASDLPGRVLTIRDQANMGSPTGRGDTRFRLASVIEGRNFRLTVNDSPSGAPFQLHQVRARMRPIGEYIDGTNGEFYESPEFAVAPARVGELKDFLLDYDVSGAGGYIQIFSDLPGTALTVRRTIPLPAQTTRGVYVFPLESAADAASDFLPTGQLFKVRIYPPAGGILRLHGRAQFRGRLIGVYFNGTNGEVFQTQPIELFGGLAIAREILCTMEAPGPMTLQIATEIPAQDVRTLTTLTLDASGSLRRIPLSARVPGNTKGILWQFTLSGPYITKLFELKIMGRRLMTNGSGWDWAQVPMEPTSSTWANIDMPVGQTPEQFSWIDLPVDPIA